MASGLSHSACSQHPGVLCRCGLSGVGAEGIGAQQSPCDPPSSSGWTLPAAVALSVAGVWALALLGTCVGSSGGLREPWPPQSPEAGTWLLLTSATLPSPAPAYSTLPCGSCHRAPCVCGCLPGWVAQAQLSVTSADPQQMAGVQAAPWPVPTALAFLSTSLLPCSGGPRARVSLSHQQMSPGGRWHPRLLAGPSSFHGTGIFLVSLPWAWSGGVLGQSERKVST